MALARALVIRPKVLLLDEPFSALDKNLRLSMQVELKAIQRKLGVTTVFVTHDQGEALSMSDRVVVMSAGHVRQIDTPDEIYRRPQDAFVASFVGDVNIVPGRYAGRDGAAVLGWVAMCCVCRRTACMPTLANALTFTCARKTSNWRRLARVRCSALR